jgi:hypothetical protein
MGNPRSLRPMTQAEHPTPEAAQPARHESALLTELRDLREELAERDERFAVLEAEMWADFEAREARHRQLLEEREQQLARARAREAQLAALQAELHQRDITIAELTESTFQLSVRLERIRSSPPARLYRAVLSRPALQWLRRWQARRFSAALARQRPR